MPDAAGTRSAQAARASSSRSSRRWSSARPTATTGCTSQARRLSHAGAARRGEVRCSRAAATTGPRACRRSRARSRALPLERALLDGEVVVLDGRRQRLPAPAELARATAASAACVYFVVRSAAPRRPRPARSCRCSSASACCARLLARPARRDAHPLQRARHGQRADVLRARLQARRRGHGRQARRRAVHVRRAPQLAQGQVHRAPGVRDRRLHRAGRRAQPLRRAAARRARRRRQAALRRQGRHRLQRASRSPSCTRSSRRSSDELAVRDPPRGADARGVHWVRPELRRRDRVHRAHRRTGWCATPSFQGLREDKPAREVHARECGRRAEPSAPRSPRARRARVRLTHPDRVLYPEHGITKRDLARYYAQVAELHAAARRAPAADAGALPRGRRQARASTRSTRRAACPRRSTACASRETQAAPSST